MFPASPRISLLGRHFSHPKTGWRSKSRLLKQESIRSHHIEIGVSSGTPFAANVNDFVDATNRLLTRETHHAGSKKVCVVGVPVDGNSSFMSGPSLAPPRIREAFHSTSANYYSETNMLDISKQIKLLDAGDLITCADEDWDAEKSAQEISTAIASLVKHDCIPLVLGGDHSISYPVVRGVVEGTSDGQPLTILHLDAHNDLYDNLDDNPYSHGSPFSRIMESGLCKRLVQVGIRCETAHLREQAERFGVEVVTMQQFSKLDATDPIELEGPVWVSVDLDVLDPAFAPGVSHHEPGGMSTRDVLNIIQNFKLKSGSIVGMDLVELNPKRDVNGVTAMVAAKLMKEMIAKLLVDMQN